MKGRIINVRYAALFAGLFFSLVLFSFIMIYNIRISYQNSKEDVLSRCDYRFEQNSENVELFFLRHEDVLLTTSKSLECLLAEKRDRDEALKLLQSISKSYSDDIYERITGRKFSGIYASVDGTLVHGMHDLEELSEDYDPLKRQWYKEGLAAGGDVVFGEPYWDIYDNDVMVMTATKLLEDGTTVVGMDIPMNDLQSVIGNMSISAVARGIEHTFGYGFLITENGIVMAHSANEGEQWKDYSDPKSPMYDIYEQAINYPFDGGQQYLEVTYLQNPYLLFVQRLSNGWYSVAMVDVADVRSFTMFSSLDVLSMTAVMAFIALLFCFLITRAYVRSDRLKDSLQKALEMVRVDSLTGQLNRAAFDMKVNELQEVFGTDKEEPYAIIMIDLNDLKYVNDHYGHYDGDRYICNCCELLKDIFGCDIYRIGGDEFALFLTGQLYNDWESLFDKLKEAVAEANLSITPTVDAPSFAIGFAIHTVDTKETVDELLLKADAEMYSNKVAIKQARLELSAEGYTNDIKRRLIDKQTLASELQKGIEDEQFEIWFQPQVDYSRHGALIGAEALARWRHPKSGLVSPAEFVPLLEYNGLIYELDKYVWRCACRHIKDWIEQGRQLIPISVNVSRYDILQPDFIETIVSIIEEYDIPYDLLHLEVTESAFSDEDGLVADVVRKLIEEGFVIAIDDFGSGYSSLSLLRGVHARIIKLDLRFFLDEENATRNECILESIIRMSKMLGMAVIAEGIEQKENADLLYMHGCDYIQGYLYSKPLPYDEFIAYVDDARSRSDYPADTPILADADTNLENTQMMFRNIISGTNDVILVINSQTKQLLYANHAAEEFYGKRYDPLQYVACTEYCMRGEHCDSCPAQNILPDEIREAVINDGKKYYKTYYSQMDWNGQDAVVYKQIDISDQMQAYEFTNAIIQNIPGATIALELDADGNPKVRYLSDYAAKVFELTGADSKNLTIEECFAHIFLEDRARVRDAAMEAFRNHTPFRETFRMELLSGGLMWVELLMNPVADSDGNYLFYGIYTDVTDRHDSQARIDAILQRIPAAMTIYAISETDFERVYISDTARELLKIYDDTDERVSSDTLFQYIYEEDRERAAYDSWYHFKNRKAFSVQFRIIGDDGNIRWVQLDSQPIDYDNSDTCTFYGIYTDITAKKQLEMGASLEEGITNMQEIVDLGLQEAMRQNSPQESIEYIIGFIGRVLHGERAYIFEKNEDNTNSNTFEWVADGIVPEKDNLQNIPEEVSRPWYEQFAKKSLVVIENLEDIKDVYPDLYDALVVQDIKSLIVAPFFDDHGTPCGFFGLDNPPKRLLMQNHKLVQTIAYFIEASIKRRNLDEDEG